MKRKFYFSPFEIVLWACSVTVITVSYILFNSGDVLTLIASLIGATALIFLAKGNPIGNAMMIVFAILYGIISLTFRYYGEMITYVCMSLPMAVLALVTWLRHPAEKGRIEVKVGRVKGKEIYLMIALTAAVTVAFWFILGALGTENLLPSTISVTTSFIAAYLSARRDPFFPLAYAFNDVVLILLWVLAGITDPSYIPVVVCFVAFLANDTYSFICWRKMEKRQKSKSENAESNC